MDNKKIVAGLLALTFVFGGTALPNTVVNNSVVASAAASDAEVLTYGDYKYTLLEDGTVEIAKYNGTDEVVEIPGEIDGVAVTSIGEEAFDGNKTITSVTIPEGIENIGRRAFFECSNLLEVTIPDGVETIGGQSFHDCYKLREVIIPDSVETLGGGAFSFCKALESVALSNKLTQINDQTFSSCESLKEIKLPSGIKSIGKQAFLSCTNLEKINLPDGLETINSEAFQNCQKLVSISMPDSVKIMGSSAFKYCYALVDVKLSANLKTISGNAFNNCTSIEKIVIPEGVTSIGGYFSSLSSLKSITLPDTLTSIGWGSLYNCKNLKEVTVPASLKNFNALAFANNYISENENKESSFTLKCYNENSSVVKKHALEYGINFKIIDAEEKTEYPELTEAQFAKIKNKDATYCQFRLKWTEVEGAQQYGIAVNLAGKWKVQAYTDAKTTTFTSPKLKSSPNNKYEMAICAKVNGKWEITNFTKRSFTITTRTY